MRCSANTGRPPIEPGTTPRASRRRFCAVLAAIMVLSAACNWAQFRFDASHSGSTGENSISTDTVATLSLDWSAAVSTAPAAPTSSPSVVDDLAFVGSAASTLQAFSTANGATVWSGPSGNGGASSPAVQNGVVYVGAGDGRLYAFNAAGCGGATCAPQWTGATGGPITSSPAVANGVVYIGSSDNKLYAFNAAGCGGATCAPQWSATTGGLASSPAVADGVVYVGSSDNALHAFTTAGVPQWTGATGGPITSSPAVANGVVYIGSGDNKLYAFNAAGCGGVTCAPQWSATTGGPVASSPAVADGVVYVGSSDNALHAFTTAGVPQWTGATGGPITSSPAVANGVVYIGSSDNKLYAFNAAGCGGATCASLWSATTNGPVTSSPAVANTRVLVVSGVPGSTLYAYRPPPPPTPTWPGTPTTRRDSGVDVSWNASVGASAYRVYRSTSPTTGFVVVADGVPGPTWSDVGLLNRLTYHYKVQALGPGGESGLSSAVSGVPDVEPYAWHFNRPGNSSEGWAGFDLNPGASVAGGALVLPVSGGDPRVFSADFLQVAATRFATVELRMKNSSPATSAKLFWITNADTTWGTNNKFVSVALTPNDTTFRSYYFTPSWSGTIRQLRVDPQENGVPGTTSVVDYVKLSGTYSPVAPLVGAIRWDSWYPGSSLQFSHQDPSVETDHDYREPFSGWSDASISVPCEFFVCDVPGNHQAIIDQEIDYAVNGGLDYWAFDWYPDPSESLDDNSAGSLGRARLDYMASAKKNQIKFAHVLQTGWVAKRNAPDDVTRWRNLLVPYFVQQFQDPQYVKVGIGEGSPRPLVFWFDSQSLPTQPGGFGGGWAAELNYFIGCVQFVNCVNAAGGLTGLGPPFIVDLTNPNAQAFGFEGLGSYGPAWDIDFSPGQKPWTTLATRDIVRRDTVRGNPANPLKNIPSLTPVMDHRPRNAGSKYAADQGTGAGFWYDLPTYGQWENHVRVNYDWLLQYPGRSSSQPGTMLVYAWNEIDEGAGGIVPTFEEGTTFLDGIAAATAGGYPSRYDDTLNDTNLSIVYSGGPWTSTTPQPPGCCRDAFNVQRGHSINSWDYRGNDEHRSATAGASATLVWNAVGFRVIGATGPGRGFMKVYTDGSLSATVDLYSAIERPGKVLYETATDLPPGVHTLRIEVPNPLQKNPVSGGYSVGIDAIKAKVARAGVIDGAGAPTILTASPEHNRIQLRWDSVQGASSYKLYRSTQNNGPYSLRASGLSQPTYSDPVAPGTTYYYVVTAVSGSESGFSNQASAASIVDSGTGKPVGNYTASSFAGAGFEPAKAFDQNASTGWRPASAAVGQWVKVDFGRSFDTYFNRVVLREQTGVVNDFQLQYCPANVTCTDGGSGWVVAYMGAEVGDSSAPRAITFPLVQGRAVRLVFTTAPDAVPTIDDFEVYVR